MSIEDSDSKKIEQQKLEQQETDKLKTGKEALDLVKAQNEGKEVTENLETSAEELLTGKDALDSIKQERQNVTEKLETSAVGEQQKLKDIPSATREEGKTNLEMAKEAAINSGTELPEGRLQVFFHGTTESNAHLHAGSEGDTLKPHQFYMTTDLKTAEHFAERTANKEGDKPGILGIAISESDYQKIQHEAKVTTGQPIEDRQGMYQEILSPAAVESLKQKDVFYFLVK